jgi:hypothetical protein
MNRSFPLILLVLAGILLLASCKSTRVAYKAPLKEEGPDYLYAKLKDNEFRFDWFSARIDANYQEKKSSSDFSGQIRIRKDSLIWVTISPALGIEMMRLLVTNDSVKYINRFSKEYFIGDYALVSRFLQIDIDFDILQALLIGNDFQFYETNSFRADVDFPEYRLSTTGRRKIRKEAETTGVNPVVLLQNIWLNPETFKITRVDLKEYMKDNRKLEANYSEFVRINGSEYPSRLNFNIQAEEMVRLRMGYSKVSTNEPLSFPFSIPGSYRRIR